jgi:hypothetical protein
MRDQSKATFISSIAICGRVQVQSPACAWEIYVCEELLQRMPGKMHPAMMTIREAYIFRDTSFILTDYHRNGTLLVSAAFIVLHPRGFAGCAESHERGADRVA